MTRNFSALSLKPVWNCVTMRLQKPRRQLAGGCEGALERVVLNFPSSATGFLAISRAAKSVSLCAGRYRLFSASYAANYFAWCVGLLRRESAIFQHGLWREGSGSAHPILLSAAVDEMRQNYKRILCRAGRDARVRLCGLFVNPGNKNGLMAREPWMKPLFWWGDVSWAWKAHAFT